MATVMLYISFGLLLLASLFKQTRTYHMLQQNSYYLSRYFSWTKTAKRASFIFVMVVTLLFCVSAVFSFANNIPFAVFSVIALFFSWFCNHARGKIAIKPIVYTQRVKRMYVSSAILFVVLFVVSLFIKNPITLAIYIASISFIALGLSPLVAVLVVGVLNRPIEKMISNHFVNDAKRILKSNPFLKIIGVTGSYGKTGTKFILGRILSEKYNTLVTPESFNTPMGVVRTVREKLKNTHEVFVVEMGAKNVGDIDELCRLANPECGIITAVGAQHLNTFKTLDNITATKFELYDWVSKKGGFCLVNGESQPIKQILPKDNAISYGMGEHCDIKAEDVCYNSSGVSFTLTLDGQKLKLSTRLLGAHNVLNIMSAVIMAYKLGVSPKDIEYAVSSLKPVEHRLELKSFVGESLIIDDAYNANPEGCLEAVRVLSSFEGYKKIIITPGLVELGEKEYEANYNLGKAAGETCDVIYFVGKKRSIPLAEGVGATAFDKANMHVADSFAEAFEGAKSHTGEKCVILFENDLPDNYLM